MNSDLVPSTQAIPRFDFSVVRRLRQREGQTLAQLSERSGVSIPVLSKLERNQSAAELDTLARLARAFDLTAGDLIALAESPLAHRSKAGAYESNSFSFHRIRYANHALILAEAPAGARLSKPEVHRDELETCWALEGRLRITIGNQVLELAPGESVQFDAAEAHSYETLADSIFLILHLRKPNRF
ncbi:MAG TPA: XRE family transcriptional regulator [Verrucomicrobiales bacterium]|nr:XRE family transcriptional regulator [Verrucomicrobiales bacterium]